MPPQAQCMGRGAMRNVRHDASEGTQAKGRLRGLRQAHVCRNAKTCTSACAPASGAGSATHA